MLVSAPKCQRSLSHNGPTQACDHVHMWQVQTTHQPEGLCPRPTRPWSCHTRTLRTTRTNPSWRLFVQNSNKHTNSATHRVREDVPRFLSSTRERTTLQAYAWPSFLALATRRDCTPESLWKGYASASYRGFLLRTASTVKWGHFGEAPERANCPPPI